MHRRERGQWIHDHLPQRIRLLDVGCFTGTDTATWADRVEHLVGVDLDPAIFHAAPEIRPIQASAAVLPFRDHAFDVVVFSEVIEHLPADLERPALEEIHRVLRVDGVLLLTTPHQGWFAWLDPMDVKRRLGLRPGKGHKHYTVAEIEELFSGLFTIDTLHLSSLILHPISTWLGAGNQNRWLRFRSRLSDWDYRHAFGRASFNMALVASPLPGLSQETRIGDPSAGTTT